jgi:hypothetical protein
MYETSHNPTKKKATPHCQKVGRQKKITKQYGKKKRQRHIAKKSGGQR